MSEHTPAPTPNRAVYGFTFFIVFKILFITYLIWVLCPKKWAIAFGITCLPDRYWSVVVPIFLLTVLATFVVIYLSMGLLMTPKWDDIRTIEDKSIRVQTIVNENKLDFLNDYITYNKEKCYCHTGRKCKKKILNTTDINEDENRKIPKLEDLNIISVSKHMYLTNK